MAAGERRLLRLGFDLHDGPLQEIVALADELRTASTQISAVVPDDFRQRVRGRFNDVHARLGALDESLRQIAHSIRSTTAVARPVADAVEAELRRAREGDRDRSGAPGRGRPVPVSATPRRSCSSASSRKRCRTCASTARPARVSVVLRSRRTFVDLTVTDDGCGFDPRGLDTDRLGLAGISERVRLLGGAVEIETTPGAGTTVRATLPQWQAVDTCGRHDLRRYFVSRRVVIASVLLAVAGFAAAVVAARRGRWPAAPAHRPPERAPRARPGPRRRPRRPRPRRRPPPVPVAKSFPAAGELLVHSVPVRVGAEPARARDQGDAPVPVRLPPAGDARGEGDDRLRRQAVVPGQHSDAPERHLWLDPRQDREAQPDPQSDRGQPAQPHDRHLPASASTSGTGPSRSGRRVRETPVGHYFVAARFVPYHDPFLGVFAVETSAYSKLTEWPGGGVVGIHGTSLPQLLGQAVSHGCVRVSNTTARKLQALAPLGTPIWIKK